MSFLPQGRSERYEVRDDAVQALREQGKLNEASQVGRGLAPAALIQYRDGGGKSPPYQIL